MKHLPGLKITLLSVLTVFTLSGGGLATVATWQQDTTIGQISVTSGQAPTIAIKNAKYFDQNHNPINPATYQFTPGTTITYTATLTTNTNQLKIEYPTPYSNLQTKWECGTHTGTANQNSFTINTTGCSQLTLKIVYPTIHDQHSAAVSAYDATISTTAGKGSWAATVNLYGDQHAPAPFHIEKIVGNSGVTIMLSTDGDLYYQGKNYFLPYNRDAKGPTPIITGHKWDNLWGPNSGENNGIIVLREKGTGEVFYLGNQPNGAADTYPLQTVATLTSDGKATATPTKINIPTGAKPILDVTFNNTDFTAVFFKGGKGIYRWGVAAGDDCYLNPSQNPVLITATANQHIGQMGLFEGSLYYTVKNANNTETLYSYIYIPSNTNGYVGDSYKGLRDAVWPQCGPAKVTTLPNNGTIEDIIMYPSVKSLYLITEKGGNLTPYVAGQDRYLVGQCTPAGMLTPALCTVTSQGLPTGVHPGSFAPNPESTLTYARKTFYRTQIGKKGWQPTPQIPIKGFWRYNLGDNIFISDIDKTQTVAWGQNGSQTITYKTLYNINKVPVFFPRYVP